MRAAPADGTRAAARLYALLYITLRPGRRQAARYLSDVRRAAVAAGDELLTIKSAIDLSHLMLLHRMLAEGLGAVVVLEDDARPTGNGARGRAGAAAFCVCARQRGRLAAYNAPQC